jgi:hypothetical protein
MNDLINLFRQETQRPILFYRIPKNASTSIYNHIGYSNIIKQHYKKIFDNADQEVYYNWFCPSHSTPEELCETIEELMGNCIRFCVIRNPWDRMVSSFNQNRKDQSWKSTGHKPNMNFKEFCSLIHKNKDNKKFLGSRPQIEWVCGKYPPHEILRFENLKSDFAAMVEKYKLKGFSKELPHENKTDHPHFSECYDSESKEMIEDVFSQDIKKFNYSFPEGSDFSNPKGSQGFLRI